MTSASGTGSALLDEVRGRLSLTASQLGALARAARTEPAQSAEDRRATAELQAAGILDDELRLHPLAAQLAEASSVPLIRMLVETSGPQGSSVAHVVVAGEAVWYSEPWPDSEPDAAVTYHRAELPTIVWDLGRLVGLHRSRVPAEAVAVTTPPGMVDGVLELASFGPQDWDDVRTVTLASNRERWPDLDPATHNRWLALVASLRSWWRITVSWGSEGEGTGHWLSVLDCGPEGYWRWDPAPDPASGRVTLRPVTGGQVWEAVGALLPSGEELRRAVKETGG